MPVFVAKFDSFDCIPIPDFIFRAEDMVSAVIKWQETLDSIHKLTAEHHDVPTIEAIEQTPFEIMDDEGINDVVEFLKECVES